MDYGPLVPTSRYNSNTTKPKCSNCAMKTCPTFSQPRKTPSEEESTQSNGNVIQKKTKNHTTKIQLRIQREDTLTQEC